MANRLENLPAELLDQVFRYIYDADSSYDDDVRRVVFNTLAALYRTSRVSMLVATPYLYRDCRFHDCPDKAYLLARTLRASPELVQYVENVVIHHSKYRSQRVWTENDATLIRRALEPRGHGLTIDALTEAFMDGCHIPAAIALLCQASGIKSMELSLHSVTQEPTAVQLEECECCDECGHWEIVFAINALRDRFTRLRRASILGKSNMWRRNGYSHTIIQVFMTMPALGTLACQEFGSYPMAIEWQAKPASSGVTRLAFGRCYLTAADLIAITDTCKALEVLCVQWTGDSNFDEPEFRHILPVDEDLPDVEQRSIMLGLQKHAMTLQSLTLENTADDGLALGYAGADVSGLTAVRVLELDSAVLAGWGGPHPTCLRLPSRLQNLTLHYHRGLQPDLHDALVAVQSSQCESLKVLRVAFPCEDGMNDEWTFTDRGGSIQDDKPAVPGLDGEYRYLLFRDSDTLRLVFDLSGRRAYLALRRSGERNSKRRTAWGV